MADWPSTASMPVPGVITPYDMLSLGLAFQGRQSLLVASSIAMTANVAYIIPFRLPEGVLAQKMFGVIGATSSGNLDLGIYTAEFQKIISTGATVMGAINTLQEFDIADTWLPPGDYFMAISNSNSSGTMFLLSVNDENITNMLVYEMTAAHPLPATLVPVKTSSQQRVPVFGIAFGTLI